MTTFLSKVLRISALLTTVLLSACTMLSLPSGGGAAPNVPKAKNVALLLPLQGSAGESGQAIRNGFLAAYYYAKQNNQVGTPEVKVVDTSGGNVVALYQQAVTNGADFIVGPLTKAEVQTLANAGGLTVPTLALNTLPSQRNVTNLYQFGLSPQDEAEQAAVKARQDGHSRALVIAPAGDWGTDVAQAFEQKWQAQGGTVVQRFAYPPKADFAGLVRGALGIEQHTKKASLNAVPRQDVDAIFMVAFPADARVIKPLLTFYNASNIPVYSTSVVYSGIPAPQYDNDLNGVIFNDMPWVVGPDIPAWTDIRNNAQTLWPASYQRSPRLYALGVDAYHLTYVFNQLATGVVGATGKLTLRNQRVYRQLEWATMQDGTPQHQ